MDIIKERLRREYNLDTIFTIPTVMYLVKSKNLSLPIIKTGNTIKNLITTGLYETILKQEGISLTGDQKLQLDQSQGIFGTMLEEPVFQEIAEILKPWVIVKS
jgi:hypothetical protein